jgi:hypothetical protein
MEKANRILRYFLSDPSGCKQRILAQIKCALIASLSPTESLGTRVKLNEIKSAMVVT